MIFDEKEWYYGVLKLIMMAPKFDYDGLKLIMMC